MIHFDLREWHDTCEENFIIYQYLANLECIQELSSTDIFKEAVNHCKLYSKRRRKTDRVAWLIHDRKHDDWIIFQKHPKEGNSMAFYKIG